MESRLRLMAAQRKCHETQHSNLTPLRACGTHERTHPHFTPRSIPLHSPPFQDCDHPFFTNLFKQIYWISFFMCIVWIGLLCHYMVEWAHEVAIIFELDPIVVALVVLATGTSIPDAIGSMVAAKNGEANMAISNAVGSNVFDILLGLGLPWLLAGLIKGEDMVVNQGGKRSIINTCYLRALLAFVPFES